jgi:hypothetical protein
MEKNCIYCSDEAKYEILDRVLNISEVCDRHYEEMRNLKLCIEIYKL